MRWVLTLETGEVVIATFTFQLDFLLQTKSKTKAKLPSGSLGVPHLLMSLLSEII